MKLTPGTPFESDRDRPIEVRGYPRSPMYMGPRGRLLARIAGKIILNRALEEVEGGELTTVDTAAESIGKSLSRALEEHGPGSAMRTYARLEHVIWGRLRGERGKKRADMGVLDCIALEFAQLDILDQPVENGPSAAPAVGDSLLVRDLEAAEAATFVQSMVENWQRINDSGQREVAFAGTQVPVAPLVAAGNDLYTRLVTEASLL